MTTTAMVQDSGVHLKQQPPRPHQPTKSADPSLRFPSASMRILSEPNDVYGISSSHKSNLSSSTIMLSNSIPTSSTSHTSSSQLPSLNTTDKPTTSRIGSISQSLSETAKERIATILHDVEKLNDVEKLYLYLQLPEGTTGNTGTAGGDNKKKVNYPFGKKTDTEVVQAYTWIQTHLLEDSVVSTPKHEVYQDYKDYCERNNFEKLCVADFGKAMRQMFPSVKPRRLGQRGNSKYCYSGLRKRLVLECPELPILDTSEPQQQQQKTVVTSGGSGYPLARTLLSKTASNGTAGGDSPWSVILQWVEQQYKRKFTSTADCARFLDEQEQSRRMSAGVVASSSSFPSSSAKTPPAIRKKEMTNQLGKKMHEKKKCDLMINGTAGVPSKVVVAGGGSTSAGPSINQPIRGHQVPKNTFNFSLAAANGGPSAFSSNNGSQMKIKSEPIDDLFHTKALFTNCNNKLSNAPQSTNAMLSPNQATANTPSALPQPNSLLSCLTKSPQAVSAATMSPTISAACGNGLFPKMYKTIQPKPSSLDFSQVVVKTEDGSYCLVGQQAVNLEKRRHSVASPFSVEALALSEGKSLNSDGGLQLPGFGSELKLAASSEADKNFKRSIEERDGIQFMAKKRHVEERGNSAVENSDLRVNELESEALFDYLHTTANNNGAVSFESVNGGTPTQQLSPALANNDSNNNKDFTQIRKYLESSLPTFNHPHGGGLKGAAINNINNNNNNGSNAIYGTVDHSNSNSNLSLTPNNFNGSFQFNDSSALCGSGGVHNSHSTHHHSVPPSPNSRRRQFNFQPISPRDTPTIPENSALEMNMLKQGNFNGNNAAAFAPQMNSVAVGTSQPPSENNSPFISPRNTPNSMSRSRNNSGQSNYSNSNQYRQTTPMLSGAGGCGGSSNNNNNNFDSGVSSISSSPFISPHPTPVPCTARIMNRMENANNSLQTNNFRQRHSSGPGGPINRTVSNVMAYHRSNSLSPMVITDGSYFLNNSNNNNNNNNNSPSYLLNSLNSDLMSSTNNSGNKCNVVTQTDLKPGFDVASNMLPSFNSTMENFPFMSKLRQRHFSNPYGAVNSNNSALMKPETPGNNNNNNNNSTITADTGTSSDESLKMLLSRSQSVPLTDPLFQGGGGGGGGSFDSSLEPHYDSFGQITSTAGNAIMNAANNSGNNSNSTGLSDLEQPSPISKSYPSTPLCVNHNESFTLPHSSSAMGTPTSTTANSSSNSLEGSGGGGDSGGGGGGGFFSNVNIEELLTNDNDPLIQSGQDLLVSGAQLNSCISEGGAVSGTGSGQDELNGDSSSPLTMGKAARDDYNDLLAEGLDQFNDGFPNCDTDFNLGLDGQASTFDDPFSEYNNYTTRAICTYQKKPDVCFL